MKKFIFSVLLLAVSTISFAHTFDLSFNHPNGGATITSDPSADVTRPSDNQLIAKTSAKTLRVSNIVMSIDGIDVCKAELHIQPGDIPNFTLEKLENNSGFRCGYESRVSNCTDIYDTFNCKLEIELKTIAQK